MTIEETCNPSRAKKLPNEDFPVRLEKYIREFSASYVYTHQASSKEPLTEKVRKSMTENVKSSAYQSLLGQQNNEFHRNDRKFVNNDEQIFNFARDDIYKNISTKKPARLNISLASYIKSIAQISCGRIRGTCWLVSDNLVLTNHHVYMMINAEREENNNPSLTILVSFDYLYPGQTEYVVTVEVDEEQVPVLENPHLDYKFLHLKESEDLRDRIPLGPIVRSCPLEEGRVIIVGHPKGNEMQEETCVVVSRHSWREKLKQRNEACTGVHIAHADLPEDTKKYDECLPYDTTLFSGASGSPVFDLNGNIVAMHTQGHVLNVEGGRQCSLMEFGVQFHAICEDIRRKYNVVEELFPNYVLGVDEQQMNEQPTAMDVD